jgi:hypothetical protein
MSADEANDLKNWMNNQIMTASKDIYKYNINVSGPNEFLEDVRNYHNFRSQFDQYPGASPTIAGQPDMFGGRFRSCRYCTIQIILYVSK